LGSAKQLAPKYLSLIGYGTDPFTVTLILAEILQFLPVEKLENPETALKLMFSKSEHYKTVKEYFMRRLYDISDFVLFELEIDTNKILEELKMTERVEALSEYSNAAGMFIIDVFEDWTTVKKISRTLSYKKHKESFFEYLIQYLENMESET
jgi:hypothetical protein